MSKALYYFKNIESGEITDDIHEARYWYSANGDSINMYRYGDNTLVATWRHS